MQVKCQTSPGWAKGLTDGMPKFIAENGVGGLYRGIVPLWGRQVCLFCRCQDGWRLDHVIPGRARFACCHQAALVSSASVQESASQTAPV